MFYGLTDIFGRLCFDSDRVPVPLYFFYHSWKLAPLLKTVNEFGPFIIAEFFPFCDKFLDLCSQDFNIR